MARAVGLGKASISFDNDDIRIEWHCAMGIKNTNG
jgi:hypothetical protein